jgi:hypothetical protein
LAHEDILRSLQNPAASAAATTGLPKSQEEAKSVRIHALISYPL